MEEFLTDLTLAISKKTNMTHGEINQIYNDCNIKRILAVIAEMHDGSVHNFKVEDFFFKGEWENIKGEAV